jgi:DNA-binding GntR family transcriptional regulator
VIINEQDESRAARVVERLRHEIVDGHRLPGERLRDQPLAESFEVSRNTVRDALRQLSREGLVVNRRHAGSVVRRLGASDVRELYVIRRLVECSAVRSSDGAHESGIAAVAAAAATSLVKRQRGAEVGTASFAFHQAIVGLVNSPQLDAFFENVLLQLRLSFAVIEDQESFQAQWIARDWGIADHVLAGRRDQAETELRAYLDDSEAMVLKAISVSESVSR